MRTFEMGSIKVGLPRGQQMCMVVLSSKFAAGEKEAMPPHSNFDSDHNSFSGGEIRAYSPAPVSARSCCPMTRNRHGISPVKILVMSVHPPEDAEWKTLREDMSSQNCGTVGLWDCEMLEKLRGAFIESLGPGELRQIGSLGGGGLLEHFRDMAILNRGVCFPYLP
ncbi:hypothetical protein TREMEDRAFT_65758 [Tremella mesenterica DSM 1558]|uniref:uncharacterized protein n=1 Tax=Tremella mesenterica (strain ATCC 24925 / CBS 8224 / DSM 1558 / NBRC 9311 / NRRL Y-6157 / RJB 2259-6 / UBC 559-6) TaxID=578456 RepID=UPI00032C013F|nr:uncharacterized protein TREMEDRAFT_65758 [Tremella mesenterica DSM 1558]EIW66160.1 hypothetical protein TREMEDRAFT_65758 [Tremella mesenterica DSM 1558]